MIASDGEGRFRKRAIAPTKSSKRRAVIAPTKAAASLPHFDPVNHGTHL